MTPLTKAAQRGITLPMLIYKIFCRPEWDAFRAAGLKIFGPTQYCAQLESSKDFAKAFMQRHGIPTAGYETFSDAAAAHDYVARKGAPIVIKADGLAAGKGVVVAMSLAEAHAAIDFMPQVNIHMGFEMIRQHRERTA
mgnify:CR=1 FL=1